MVAPTWMATLVRMYCPAAAQCRPELPNCTPSVAPKRATIGSRSDAALGRRAEDDPIDTGQASHDGLEAVPAMIDAALDEKVEPVQRAWLLALLASITHANDPRDESGCYLLLTAKDA